MTTDPPISAAHVAPSPAIAPAPAAPDRRMERTLKTSAVVLLIGGCIVVVWPFLSALMWAAILCFTTWPLYARLLKAVGGRRSAAAALMTLAITLVLVAPFAVMAASLSDDVQHASESIRTHLADGPPPPPAFLLKIPLVGSRLDLYWRELAGSNAARVQQLHEWIEPIKTYSLKIVVAMGSGMVELFASLIIAFFLYRDGVAAADRLTRAIDRLGGEQGRQLLDTAGKTVRGVVYGILGTALAQSVVAGIGFAIARIPQAALLAFLTFFLSVLPVGPPLIWIPATLWLLAKGKIGWAIFMACWGVLISSVDNVIKPLIISRGGSLPFILILLGILGGALAFGFIGVFLGPTLLAMGFQLIAVWTGSPDEFGATPQAAKNIEPAVPTADALH
jgi:predicted PurR-regulated permease PerM